MSQYDSDKGIEDLAKAFCAPKFYILIGNIGAGKSTYIKNNIQKGIVISKDSIRYAIGGGNYKFNPNLEPVIHSTTIHMAHKFCEKQVSEIVLDETNVEAKNRKAWIDIAKKQGYYIVAMEFPKFDKEIAVARRLTNPHCQPDAELWCNVWDKFNKKYQKPTLEEGFDSILQIEEKEVI